MYTTENTLAINYTTLFHDIELFCKQRKDDTFDVLEKIDISAVRLAKYITQFPRIYDATKYSKSDVLAAIPILIYEKLCSVFQLDKNAYIANPISADSDKVSLEELLGTIETKKETDSIEDDFEEFYTDVKVHKKVKSTDISNNNIKPSGREESEMNTKSTKTNIKQDKPTLTKLVAPVEAKRCNGVMRDPITGKFLKKNTTTNTTSKPNTQPIEISKDVVKPQTKSATSKLTKSNPIASNSTSSNTIKPKYLLDDIIISLPKLTSEELHTLVDECIKQYMQREALAKKSSK